MKNYLCKVELRTITYEYEVKTKGRQQVRIDHYTTIETDDFCVEEIKRDVKKDKFEMAFMLRPVKGERVLYKDKYYRIKDIVHENDEAIIILNDVIESNFEEKWKEKEERREKARQDVKLSHYEKVLWEKDALFDTNNFILKSKQDKKWYQFWK